MVHLRRHSGKGEANFIEVKAKSLARDGDIPLEANDIIEVVSSKAG